MDRALETIQTVKLPIPRIEKHDDFTRITLYRTRDIFKLTNEEKAKSIYWHCTLIFVLNGQPLTNELVCERFGIQEQNRSDASRLLKLAKDAQLIKPFDPTSNSKKYARYIPFWAN